ncbi:MAG TPA: glycosyltransferase family 39 protein, partial [Anaerolineae bacterium]|nr:glycosyltransferase family 39 protein [Anaerolineae bacterium]
MLERNRHFTRVLVLVVLVALALRVWGLTTQSLWYDEGFSVNLAGQSWGRILLGELNLPPLYHLLLGAWVRLAGSGEFAVRYFSVFWGVLLVVLGGAWVSRLLGPRAGALCALLLAMSPIEVWYAQETRMYAMLGALALASSYLLTCLLAPPLRSNDLSRSSLTAEAVTTRGGWLWALYALVNIAAVYTHYYAALVLAAQAVWLLLHLVRTRDWRPARAWLLAQAALGLALLPWLPVFWGQWQAANTTYWPGRLSLGFVAGRAMLGFAGAGLTVADSAALGLALPLAALAALGLLVGLARPRWRWGTLCLLVYLLVPLALFYALVRDRPKFSPRYLLPIVPPLLALAAGALAALWPASLRDRRGWARSGLAVLLAVGTVVGSAAAAGNAQRDAAYGRDDLRGVAAFLTQAAAADEAVILVSGHLEPAFTYYYRGANCFPIPPRYTPSPSVDDVLTPAAFEDLNRAIVGRRGAWLVLWQDNVVDPNGVVLTALELAAHEAADAPAFRGVELHHFVFPLGLQLQPEMFAQHPLGVTIGDGELALVGCTLPSDPVPAGTSASAVLLWQTVRPVPHDYRLSLRMIDGQGQERVREDSRLGGYMYPTDHWRPGLQVVGSHRVPLPLSLPPGEYALQATIYRIGDRASQTVPLGNFRVGRALRQPTARELGIDRPLGLIFGELEVMGSRLAPSEA